MARLSPERLVYTSAFGARDPIKTSAGTTPNFHWGIDYGPEVRNKAGVILQAVIGGKVTWLSDQYGALGIRIGDRSTVAIDLWHLEKRLVPSGSTVAEGTAIGVMGSTGRSTGVHVHVEYWINGVRRDPKPFIDAQASKAVAPAPPDYEEDAMSAAEVRQIIDYVEAAALVTRQVTRDEAAANRRHTQAVANNLSAELATLTSRIRREVRPLLRFVNVGADGKTYTLGTSPYAAAVHPASAFVLPLNFDTDGDRGQVTSLQSGRYRVIATDDRGEGTDEASFFKELGDLLRASGRIDPLSDEPTKVAAARALFATK